MQNKQYIPILKSINRYVRKAQCFKGGMQYGVDFSTWYICHTQLAISFNKFARLYKGLTNKDKETRFMPLFR